MMQMDGSDVLVVISFNLIDWLIDWLIEWDLLIMIFTATNAAWLSKTYALCKTVNSSDFDV